MESFDFALAFAVIHEIAEPSALFFQLYRALKTEGKLLMSEPKGHVSDEYFSASIQAAKEDGFAIIDRPRIFGTRTALFQKQQN